MTRARRFAFIELPVLLALAAGVILIVAMQSNGGSAAECLETDPTCAVAAGATAQPTETPGPTETEVPTETPDSTETFEPTETPGTTETATATLSTGTPTPTAAGDCVPPGPNDSALAHCADTLANLSGASNGAAPVVEQKWELPDMDASIFSVQYTDSTAGHDPCVWNATNTAYINTPCIDDNGNDIPNSNTGQHGHFHHDTDPCKLGALGCQLTVAPNVDDKPQKRTVRIWAIVSDAVGGVGDIASVQAIVTYNLNEACAGGESAGAAGLATCPGEKKITEPTHPVQLSKVTCASLFETPGEGGDPGETNGNSAIHAAVNTGQLQHAKLSLEDCLQQEWAPYHGDFLLNNDQPWGKYQVCVQAIDTSSNLGQRCNFLFVQNVVAFKLDFTTVNFGAISAGIPKTVSPGNLTNTGNADACLAVIFGEMVGKDLQGTIDFFSAELKGQSQPLSAGNSRQFTVPIESKGVNKLRFTIHPPSSLAPDTYQGRVDLSVKKCPIPP